MNFTIFINFGFGCIIGAVVTQITLAIKNRKRQDRRCENKKPNNYADQTIFKIDTKLLNPCNFRSGYHIVSAKYALTQEDINKLDEEVKRNIGEQIIREIFKRNLVIIKQYNGSDGSLDKEYHCRIWLPNSSSIINNESDN